MQITINMTIDDAAAAATASRLEPREVAALSLRDLADQIEAGTGSRSFIGSTLDDVTGAWIGGVHVVIATEPQGEAQPLVICEEKTARGFAKVAFSDHYGVACSIQKSSLATEEAIWIGADDLGLQRFASDYTGWHNVDLSEVFPGQTISANTRMHLTQDEVGALLPVLVHFAQTGQVAARCAHPSAAPVIAGMVKPLLWVRDPDNAGDDWFSRAWADVYCYEVGQDDGPEATWWWQEDAVTSMAAVNGFASEDAAKEAAQADFATRILSQIEGQV